MTNEEIIEGNKLIADFKGWVWHENEEYMAHEMKRLKYHSSWDWLMPIVEKIATIPCYIYEPEGEQELCTMITFHSNMARIKGHQLFEADTQIEAVWLAVVDFIKGYNEIKPTI